LKKWNTDDADIYDIKSRLVQYPLLQEGAKGRVIHFYLINMCIVLNIKYKLKFAWYLTFPPQRTNKYLKTTILKALLMKK